MGKLHSLKRAILRNPEIWYKTIQPSHTVYFGAIKYKNEWKPSKLSCNTSYVNYVKKVIEEIGLTDIRSGELLEYQI